MRGALTALLFFARTTHAQRLESSVDVGGAALRYADSLSTGAAAITPHLFADWNSGFVDATGTYSQFTAGGWSAQGTLAASRFVFAPRGFVAELGGFVGGSSHNDGTRTGEVIANARLHLARGTGELFFGAGGGRTWDAIAWRTVLLGEAEAAVGVGRTSGVLTLSPAVVNDSIKYADAQASISWKPAERLDIGALAGIRIGDQLTTLGANAKSWASVTMVDWMRPRVALTASGGTYPVDPTQGFPGGRFVSLGVRFATGHYGTPVPVPAAPEVAPTQEVIPAITGFTTVRGGPDTLTLKVNAPQAQLVELSGDFTNWEPVRLNPDPSANGWWLVALPMRPGKYQMNVRVNGGPWLVPPGLLSMADEFGGTVGLLIVE